MDLTEYLNIVDMDITDVNTVDVDLTGQFYNQMFSYLFSFKLLLKNTFRTGDSPPGDADLCGGCQQRFKGKIGLTSHQARAANKACRDQRGGK